MNRIASIHRIEIINLPLLSYRWFLGDDTIAIEPSEVVIVKSSGHSLTEVVDGNGMISVDFSFSISDSLAAVSDIYDKPVLVKLYYTNQVVKILGVPECPVVLSLEKSGLYASSKLTYKGLQPNFSKLLTSF